MKTNHLKSIGAIFAGFAVGAALSIGMDKILETSGAMKTEPFDANPSWLIIVVLVYRSVFNAFGAWLAARLAPADPMKHAMILGIIGTMLTIAGAIAMWHIQPHWYPLSLIVITLPSAWAGGKIAAHSLTSKNK